jgi:hypothetical protein
MPMPLHLLPRAALLGLALLLPAAAVAQTRPVTLHDFVRAETDRYIADFARRGTPGAFAHDRQATPVTDQPVIRMNRDTLYSSAVVDLDAGPATVTLPDAGPRFVSLLAIDQDHFVYGVFYAPATFVFTREQVGTRYLVLLVRTFANPDDAADIRAAHAVQDAIALRQASPGRIELPAWDQRALDAIRGQLNGLATHLAGFGRAFGRREEVDRIDHLIGTAAGWGGNPRGAAIYMPIVPPAGAAAAGWRMRLPEVPVDGFWSVTVYNAAGFMEANPRNAYALNNVTARREADGSTMLQFGACADATANCIPTPSGWNAVLRLYRPRAEILDGRWRMPALEPIR